MHLARDFQKIYHTLIKLVYNSLNLRGLMSVSVDLDPVLAFGAIMCLYSVAPNRKIVDKYPEAMESTVNNIKK